VTIEQGPYSHKNSVEGSVCLHIVLGVIRTSYGACFVPVSLQTKEQFMCLQCLETGYTISVSKTFGRQSTVSDHNEVVWQTRMLSALHPDETVNTGKRDLEDKVT
jgi:hypothetical protein